jgi:crotonobetainyl-CoA:carnitine CoA-transferase CaiB-like acyl-CoA transferase
MAGALDGIRVIDVGQWIAGPLSALLLADQGAEVIHVDPPGGPRWQAAVNATLQRGKKSLIRDLKTGADLAFARTLIGSADVLIENFRPGVMDRLGLGWEAVRHGHDRLIYCSLPGFASDDRRAAMPAWEGILAAATGTYVGRGPVRSSRPPTEPAAGAIDQPRFNALSLASEFGALAAAIAIVMALIARERDGFGQRIEVPLFDAMFLAFGASGLLVNGAAAGGRPSDPWSGTYQCRDGAMVLLNLATPRFVHRFLEATGTLAEWTTKGYLESDRLVHDEELWAQQRLDLSALLRTGTAEEWDRLATQVLFPLTRIRTSAEWIGSKHAQHAGIVVSVDDPEYGRMLQPGPSVRLLGLTSTTPLPRASSGLLSRADLLASRGSAVIREEAAAGHLASALEGFRVVDTTQVLAGPTAARTLAEFGAQVIKINNPWEEGAGYRWQVHRYHTDVNRGKYSILIDLKRAEGLEILGRLVDRADAFLQNLRLGVGERLGFGYEQVRHRKPDIVYLSVSAFGYGGEWQYRPGYEPNAQSIAGMQARMAGSADRPSGQPFAINDYCTGLLGAFGLGLGLFHRLRTGEGVCVETSLGHAATYLQLPYMQTFKGKTWDEPSGTQARGWGPLQRLYRAADAWFFLGAKATQIERLATIPGLEAVLGLAGERLAAQLEASFRAKPADEWVRLLVEADIGAHTLGHVTQLMRDPRAVAHGLSVTRRHSDGSMITTIGPPARLSRTPAMPGRAVSPPGGDAREVLALIGMEDKLNNLVRKRVIALD